MWLQFDEEGKERSLVQTANEEPYLSDTVEVYWWYVWSCDQGPSHSKLPVLHADTARWTHCGGILSRDLRMLN